MMKRERRILSIILAAALALCSNAIAFASEVEEDHIEAEADTAVIDTYDPAGGDQDDIEKDQYAQVPDNWSINADPATWDTATEIVSTNKPYYGYTDERNVWFDPDWRVYSPFSYFFYEDFHLVDNSLVVPKNFKYEYEPVLYRAVDAGDGLYVLLRVREANPNSLKYPDNNYGDSDYNFGKNIKVFRPDKSAEGKYVLDSYNTRYKGDEPVLTYNGLKFVEQSLDNDDNPVFKKGECPKFNVEAVLVKHEDGKNTIIKGLDVKSVKFRNNLHASLPSRIENTKQPDMDENGKGSEYINGYKVTYEREDVISDVEYVGPDWKDHLTKQENSNYKGQPSFTVTLEAKGDAKKYSKQVNKAMKSSKGDTFKFEIRQLDIGDYQDYELNDINVPFTYAADEDNSDNIDKATAAMKAKYDSYVDTIAAYIFADKDNYYYLRNLNDAKEYVKYYMVQAYDDDSNRIFDRGRKLETYNAEDKCYEGFLELTNIPLFAVKELDIIDVSENAVDTSGIKLEVVDQDAKNLEFNKSKTKVSAKLNLSTSMQIESTAESAKYDFNRDWVGGMSAGGKPVVTNEKFYSKTLKTTTNESKTRHADALLKVLNVNDSVYGYGTVPLAVVKGYNDLTGACTIRLHTDIHGNDEVRYGYYKDDEHFVLDSAD